MFGQKTPEGASVLVLDIENGSVGGAIAYISQDAPKLLSESRIALRVLPTRDTRSLMENLKEGVHEIVEKLSHAAAGLRSHVPTKPMGEVSRAAVYLGAPWGKPNLETQSPEFVGILREFIANELERHSLKPSFSTSMGGALGGARHVLPSDGAYVLCLVGGELTELLVICDGLAMGYGTLPMGAHTLVRTLRAHGMSDAEATSAVKLSSQSFAEPLRALGEDFGSQFGEIGNPLLERAQAKRVWVVSGGPAGEWFARALSQQDLSHLFPQGGEVRLMRASHITPYLSAHAQNHDVLLGLYTLGIAAHS